MTRNESALILVFGITIIDAISIWLMRMPPLLIYVVKVKILILLIVGAALIITRAISKVDAAQQGVTKASKLENDEQKEEHPGGTD